MTKLTSLRRQDLRANLDDEWEEFVITSLIFFVCATFRFWRSEGTNIYVSFLGKSLTKGASFFLYLGFFLLTMWLHIKVWRGRKNMGTELLMAVVPMELVMLLANGLQYKFFLFLFLMIVVMLLLKDWLYIKRQQRRRSFLMKSTRLNAGRIISWMRGNTRRRLGTALYAYLSLFLVLSVLSGWLGNRKHYSTNAESGQFSSSADLWEENKEELVKLNADRFCNLSHQEKLDAYQVIINMETAYLGCDSVQLASQCLCDQELAGYYNHRKRLIVIDTEILDADSELDIGYCISVLLHEVYHTYENDCVDALEHAKIENTNLLFYQNIESWKEELEDYQTYQGEDAGYESYLAYSSQSVEQCADNYADDWTNYYMCHIEYLDMDEE
jgi:membrane protein implicated in regulation of membrane protease activity